MVDRIVAPPSVPPTPLDIKLDELRKRKVWTPADQTEALRLLLDDYFVRKTQRGRGAP